MKCPKCHYLSFEPEPRCRNCGYDLSVPSGPDLELHTSEPYEGPLLDLTLKPAESGVRAVATTGATLGPIDLDRVVGEPEPAEPSAPSGEEATAATRRADTEPPPLRVLPAPGRPVRAERPARRAAVKLAPSTTAELPLFVKKRPEADPDAPLVSVPAVPAVPLAVRRAHDAPRPKPASRPRQSSPELGPLERDLLQDLRRLEERVAERARESAHSSDTAEHGVVARRLLSAAIDATLLGSISAAVLWATLRLCDLGLGEAATLPIVPLAAFLLLVAAGYLVMFTVAGGQTVGKMMTGLRVVSSDEDGSAGVTPTQAVVRAVVTVPSVLAFGLGFLPAIAGHGRALHDRLSHTRVVLV